MRTFEVTAAMLLALERVAADSRRCRKGDWEDLHEALAALDAHE